MLIDSLTIYIYIDESGINDRISTAIFYLTSQYIEQHYLKTSLESIIYTIELNTISMAITYVKKLTIGLMGIQRSIICYIFIDS